MAPGHSQSDSCSTFHFSPKSFVQHTDWNYYENSEFDKKLESSWLSKESLFRYKLSIDKAKKLSGSCGFFAQLNVNRAVNRRSPVDIQHVRQPFSQEQFNFTKITSNEIMFSLAKENEEPSELDKDYILVNVSPLEHCNCLLCPQLKRCLNQVVTQHSLYFALNFLLLSSSPELRIGFNSLCAQASVNHLHFHAYYLKEIMTLETIKVDHLSGQCYTLEDFPSKGYVFQLTSPSDLPVIVNDVYKLTTFLTNEDIAHNIYMTRGLNFEEASSGFETTKRDSIRIYIWARTPSCGAKVVDAFNPALCELFGHLVVKSEEAYDKLTEASVAEILDSITSGPFRSTKDRVKELYQDL